MDKKTLDIYNAKASHYTQDWLQQADPEEIHNIVKKYFSKGALTADIGSGSGRDSNWLNENGYPCTGYDASEGLLQEARNKFPHLTFRFSSLPDLKDIGDASYKNVLCETVLMHLPKAEHLASIQNLLRITQAGGTLSLSWRHPISPDNSREKDGRLYEEINREEIIAFAKSHGAHCVYQNTVTSSSSGKKIDQVIFIKST